MSIKEFLQAILWLISVMFYVVFLHALATAITPNVLHQIILIAVLGLSTAFVVVSIILKIKKRSVKKFWHDFFTPDDEKAAAR